MSVSEKAANFPTDRCEVCGREPPRVMTPNEARARASPTPDEDLRDIYLAMQAADDERNRLRGALRRVRAWLAGYVANGGKDADEELQIADAALTADDRQVEAGSVVDRYRRSKAIASPTPDEPSEDEVERVARALCVSHGQNPDARIEHVGAVDNYTRMWEAHKTHARAAIAALRNKR